MDAPEFNIVIRHLHKEGNLAKLFEEFYPNLVKILSKKFGRSVAEDAVQLVFSKLAEENYSGKYVDRPMSWMLTCCMNRARNIVLADGKYVFVESIKDIIVAEDFSVEDRLELHEVLEELTEEEQRIVYLHIWDKFTFGEIAEFMSSKESTIRQKFRRALKRMEKIYKNLSRNG